MNKWQEPFKKNDCLCSNNQGLFIPNRQLSIIVATTLFLGFAIFMTGYFLGKKTVVQQLTEKIQQDAFADQIYTSLLTQEQDVAEKVDNVAMLHQESCIVHEENNTSALSCPDRDTASRESLDIIDNETMLEQQITQYYAQLIGFGTEKSAQTFVKKLAARGVETEIKKRTSKTAKGRTSYWYQVVTLAYSNKDELVELVNKITKEENIKDANIRVC